MLLGVDATRYKLLFLYWLTILTIYLVIIVVAAAVVDDAVVIIIVVAWMLSLNSMRECLPFRCQNTFARIQQWDFSSTATPLSTIQFVLNFCTSRSRR